MWCVLSEPTLSAVRSKHLYKANDAPDQRLWWEGLS